MSSKDDITKIIISDEEEREERIHELLKGRRSLNINIESSKKLTLGQRCADRMAQFAGSWFFVIVFAIIVLSWAFLNTRFILGTPFDPYPYVFLNLILACIASLQAPIIMMSQNRDAEKDRLKLENDYLINLKSEIILEDLHLKIDNIIKEQKSLKKELSDLKINVNKAYMKGLRNKDGKREPHEHTKKDSGGKEPELYS